MSGLGPSLKVRVLSPQDVIFDGTMMWAPFVEQTIAMVRDHARVYRRGPGYTKAPDGHHVERCARHPSHASDWQQRTAMPCIKGALM